MAKKISGTRRVARVSRGPMAIQRNINADYAALGRDYKKLARELWRMPVTRYIFGGLALTVLSPWLLRSARRVPQVDSFFADLGGDFADVKETISGKISSLRGNVSDELADIQH